MSEFRLHFDLALVFLILTGLTLSLGVPGCSETLPPYEVPHGLIRTVLQISSGFFANRWPIGTTPLPIRIMFVNMSDEVLQDSVSMAGSVELWKAVDPSKRAHISTRFAVLMPPASNGILTLQPDDEQLILLDWNQKFDSQADPWIGSRFTRFADTSGETYLQTEPIVFCARATVHPFQAYNALTTEQVQFSIVYQLFQGHL